MWGGGGGSEQPQTHRAREGPPGLGAYCRRPPQMAEEVSRTISNTLESGSIRKIQTMIADMQTTLDVRLEAQKDVQRTEEIRRCGGGGGLGTGGWRVPRGGPAWPGC